ncbi:MAG: hypothetical protein JKY90_07395, partial [Gammaproteobacteria bacterium]|nr:hypothetical protein [Gammaproteobacteria bacterium]
MNLKNRIYTPYLTVLLLCALSACGGGGGSGTPNSSNTTNSVNFERGQLSAPASLNGGGIKGPLAHATVNVYQLDPSSPGFFDSNNPIATGNTDANAAIQNLSFPAGTTLPLILEVDGTASTDLITGQTPVLRKLVTVITRDQIEAGVSVYATPLSTMSYLVAKNAASNGSVNVFLNQLTPANDLVLSVFNFGLGANLNTFLTSPLIDSNATTVERQQLAAQYRAANEALAAVVYQATNQLRSSGTNVNEDTILAQLARDLQADLRIDNRAANASLPHNINLDIIRANALDLNIPQSSIRIRDIVTVLEGELQLGNSTATFLIPNYTPPITQALLNADIDNDGIVNARDNSNGNTRNNNTSGATVLNADFERLSRGAYRESDLRSDFNVNSWRSNGLSEFRRYRNETVHGPNASSMDIVVDPANSGRGNVLRTLHRQGRGGNSIAAGGFRFRADLPPSNEYYFAYDFYIPSGWFQPLQFKMPALINGTLLEASHGGETPSPETLVAFNSRMQLFSASAFNRDDGSLCSIVYDKDSVQRPRWTNFLNSTSLDFSGQRDNLAGQYIMPRGRWVKIEQYVKVNTNGLNNGKMMMWADGELIYD